MVIFEFRLFAFEAFQLVINRISMVIYRGVNFEDCRLNLNNAKPDSQEPGAERHAARETIAALITPGRPDCLS